MKTLIRGLVGDVGGANARLALVDDAGHIRFPQTYACRDHASLTAVIAAYLKSVDNRQRPTRAAIAVAGPVVDGEIEFTNLDWRVSEGELLSTFELEAVSLLNDFAAQALAAPRLDAESLRRIGPKRFGSEYAPIVVLGAGAGFGVAALARSERGETPIPTEGGHAGFAPADDLEAEHWKRLRARHGRVSVERVLSGPGLFDLYRTLAELESRACDHANEQAVFEAANAGEALANAALDRFCAILGGVAGDFALAFGARGGVYIGGGIAPRIADRLDAGGFRARFEDKGRLSEYVREIPTYLITHPYPALVGAARELAQLEGIGFGRR